MGRSRRALVELAPQRETSAPTRQTPRREGLSARDRRLLLGDAAVLSVSDAASLLPMADGAARRWLRAKGLVRDLDGRSVVNWGDVVDVLREGEPVAPVRERRRVSRASVEQPRLRLHPI